MQIYVNVIDLVKSLPASLWLQKSASIRPRTSFSDLGDFVLLRGFLVFFQARTSVEESNVSRAVCVRPKRGESDACVSEVARAPNEVWVECSFCQRRRRVAPPPVAGEIWVRRCLSPFFCRCAASEQRPPLVRPFFLACPPPFFFYLDGPTHAKSLGHSLSYSTSRLSSYRRQRRESSLSGLIIFSDYLEL